MAVRALPPHLFVAARGDHLRRQRAVEALVPLLGDQRLNGREIIEPRQHLSVGAVRAAVAALHALRDHGAVGVPLFASPPHTAVRARGDAARSKRTVFLLVPLRGNVGVQRREVVFAGQRLPAGADRTARAEGGPRKDCCTPRVAFWTAPPDFAPCAGDHLRRQKRHVFCRIPFFRDRWVLGCERGFLGQDILPRAVRTPAALHARLDGGTVGMPFRTAPPDELVAAGRDILRCQRRVLLDVPLCREQRKLLHQAALFRRNLAPRAVGATCALAAGVHHGLP